MNTIIEKIKTWVNQRKKALHSTLFNDEYNDFLRFLSDLEKEEKPSEGLEEEIERYLHSLGVGYGGWVDGMEDDDLRGIARHFAKWGAEHAREQRKPKPSEELETEALRSAGVLLSEHFEDEDDDAIRTTALRCWKGGVIHGASWQKEQLMKEAVEGIVTTRSMAGNIVTAHIDHQFKDGQKVKLIIVKED